VALLSELLGLLGAGDLELSPGLHELVLGS
jgi:hypothetical protein